MAGDPAVGMIEVQGVAAAIVGADAACKAADVKLAGWASIGGYTTAFFTGSISDVAAALRSGEEAARGVIEHVVAVPLHQPAALPVVISSIFRSGPTATFPLVLWGWSRRAAMGLTFTPTIRWSRRLPSR